MVLFSLPCKMPGVKGNIRKYFYELKAGETHDDRGVSQTSSRCKLCGNIYKANDRNTSSRTSTTTKCHLAGASVTPLITRYLGPNEMKPLQGLSLETLLLDHLVLQLMDLSFTSGNLIKL